VEFAAVNSRAADVIIVGRAREADTEPGFFLPVGPLIMTAGRPVLLVPPGVEALSADRIVVAWKDGRHARSAIQQALPFLAKASEVTVVGVGEEVDEQQLDDVCRYLRLHQVSAAPHWRGLGRQTAAEAIVAEAVRAGSDLIVAGGYGRRRLLEWALGGVTEDLLAKSPVCCLLAH
jgi:nucleotide-binding universal stress UspA family protein